MILHHKQLFCLCSLAILLLGLSAAGRPLPQSPEDKRIASLADGFQMVSRSAYEQSLAQPADSPALDITDRCKPYIIEAGSSAAIGAMVQAAKFSPLRAVPQGGNNVVTFISFWDGWWWHYATVKISIGFSRDILGVGDVTEVRCYVVFNHSSRQR